MMDKYDFRGAWISPDGKAHWTSAVLSHMKAIRELGLEQQLRETSAKVQWTSEEDAMHRKDDLPYVALKAGYIRILAFSDQVAVQYGDFQMDDNKKKTLIDVLCKLSQSTSYHSTTYVLEKFERDYTLADTIENAVFLLESESK